MNKHSTSRYSSQAGAFLGVLICSTLLTHFLGLAQAAQTGNQQASESTSSSQPLWSYQIKPTNYVGAQVGPGGANQPPNGAYTAGGIGPFPSLFDAFTGLSQRQGALTSSPFMTILPIILIAAGGMLLLLPLFTMMMASPFGGGFGGGFQSGPFGYPQVGGLNKKRSLDQSKGILDMIENFSSTLEDLSRKYNYPSLQQYQHQQGSQSTIGANQQQPHKRSAKSLNDSPVATMPANHKSGDDLSMATAAGSTTADNSGNKLSLVADSLLAVS